MSDQNNISNNQAEKANAETSPDENEADAARKLADMDKDKAISKLEDEIENLNSQLNTQANELKKLEDRNATLAGKNDELFQNNKKCTDQITQLEKQVTDCQQSIADLHIEKDSLKNEIDTITAEYESLKSEKIEFAHKVQDLQSEKANSDELTKKITKLEKELAKFKMPADDIDSSETPSATFRVDIYKRQGEYNGRIIHTISKDKKAFHGIDVDLLSDFIQEHLPKIEDQNDVSKESSDEKEAMAHRLSVDINVAQKDIRANKPFNVQLSINRGALAEKVKTLNGVVEFFARDIVSGKSTTLLRKNLAPSNRQEMLFNEVAHPLAPGTYRLEGAVFFRSKEGRPTPYMAASPTRLVNVQ